MKTKKNIIDLSKINKVDYKNRSFKKGLRSVKKRIEETNKFRTIDSSKLHERYN